MKKIIKLILLAAALLTLLIGASLAYSQYRMNQIHLSVVNNTTYTQNDIDRLFEKNDASQLHLMIYDENSENCVYLDEVLLKEISYENDGQEFPDIYKIKYEDAFKTYTNQTIKNLFQIESIPAIVTIQKKNDSFETIDSYQWIGNANEDKANLTAYLERNELLGPY